MPLKSSRKQRERSEMASKLKGHTAAVVGEQSGGQQNVHKLLGPGMGATIRVPEAVRGLEGASSSTTNPLGPLRSESACGSWRRSSPVEHDEIKSATPKWMTKPRKTGTQISQTESRQQYFASYIDGIGRFHVCSKVRYDAKQLQQRSQCEHFLEQLGSQSTRRVGNVQTVRAAIGGEKETRGWSKRGTKLC